VRIEEEGSMKKRGIEWFVDQLAIPGQGKTGYLRVESMQAYMPFRSPHTKP
jgi:hypothetical protein